MVVESCNHHGWGIDLGLERLRQMNLGILPGVRHCCCRPSWSRWSNSCLLRFDIRLVDLNERLVKFRNRWGIVRCVYILIIDRDWESLHRLISVHHWLGRLFHDDSLRCIHSTLVKEALALVFLQYHLCLHEMVFLLWILSQIQQRWSAGSCSARLLTNCHCLGLRRGIVSKDEITTRLFQRLIN